MSEVPPWDDGRDHDLRAPLIDVVVVVKSPAPWLAVALASIQSQTFQHVQVIVGVHGTDDALSLIATSVIPTAKVLDIPSDLNLAAARNAAVRAGSAPLVAILDSDDIASPKRLQSQVAALGQDASAVMAVGPLDEIDSRGVALGVSRGTASGRWIVPRLIVRNLFPHSSVVMRRSAWQLVGGYDVTAVGAEDYELFLRLAAIGGIVVSSQPLGCYRVHDKQTSRRTRIDDRTKRLIETRRLELSCPNSLMHLIVRAWSKVWNKIT